MTRFEKRYLLNIRRRLDNANFIINQLVECDPSERAKSMEEVARYLKQLTFISHDLDIIVADSTSDPVT